MQVGSSRVQWYHPGEIVVVTRVPLQAAARREQMHADVHSALRRYAEAHLVPDHSATRSYTFKAPGLPTSLVFTFHELANGNEPRAVKEAVEALHRSQQSVRSDGVEVIGAMPHWHMRAHEAYGGGSPGSFPRPVYPDEVPTPWKSRFYQPINRKLDLMEAASALEPVPVAVLDTVPNLDQALLHADHVGNNQLSTTVNWLRQHAKVDAEWQAERDEIDKHHAEQADLVGGSEPRPYLMADHGLFVAGLIHGIAPRANLTLEPVLDEMGVGDLSLLLHGLERIVNGKEPHEPQIINLSLGFLPHPARLPAAWFGLRRPADPLYVHAPEMYDPNRDEHWVAANRAEVSQTVESLEVGLRELGRYLSLNNCLVVAAAGNDSLAQVEARQARLEPRLPARFDTVLGVAATTSNPRQAARYSNVGDERELGDHVATFGGNASEVWEPEDGVIGIYSSEFPDGRPNETGWAYWSGTSFATGIISGIVANYWAVGRAEDPKLHAATVLADLHDEASRFGPYVPALRTPSIEVRGRWGPS